MPRRAKRRARSFAKLLADKLRAAVPQLLVTTIVVVVRVMLDRHVG